MYRNEPASSVGVDSACKLKHVGSALPLCYLVSLVDSNCKNTHFNNLHNNCYLMSGEAQFILMNISEFISCIIKLLSYL